MDTLRLFTVDDEAAMRTAIRRALSTYRAHVPQMNLEVAFEMADAGSAEEALQKISESPPDILLLDQKLPGMSGTELMEALSERGVEPLVIMITAYATIETAIQATKRGAYDFLPKPFTPEELRSTLQKAAEHVVVSYQARKLAEERRQVRFQFISVLAHELKAPINAVRGFIDILRDQGDEVTPENRTMIYDRCAFRLHYMRKMIDDLLDLTRLESGQKKRELQPVDLRSVVEEAVETAGPAAEEKAVSIELEAQPGLSMFADRGEIEIVLNNLISNAVKYNRNGGRVWVRVSETGPEIQIEVEDTGIGMTQEETMRLFEDFSRIKNDLTRDIPGSGLGLSIVKKIAQLYDGTATVKSTPGTGSTFTVVLRNQQPSDLQGAAS